MASKLLMFNEADGKAALDKSVKDTKKTFSNHDTATSRKVGLGAGRHARRAGRTHTGLEQVRV